MKRGLIALLLVLVCCGTAQAQTVVTTPGPYQRWVNESRMPSAPESVEVVESRCPGYDYAPACTGPDEDVIWFARQDIAALARRETFWHELGHRFDYGVLNSRRRHWLRSVLNLPATAGWREHLGKNRIASEDFADIYGNCSRPKGLLEFTGVSFRQQHRICNAIQTWGDLTVALPGR